MKAIIREQYGSPDVVQLVDAEKPTPKDGEVLIKVHAASVNPYDWRFMRAKPFLVRLDQGFRKPKDPRLGADFAGVVEAVGAGVTNLKPGDAVFGEVTLGSFAEYVCAPADAVTLKPDNISFEQAAAAPMVGLTALQGLRDAGNIQAGEKVLVNGASGGIGTFAVQIAKFFGTEVTGVTSTRNLDMVRGIGADDVVDYTQGDFTTSGKQYDLLFDTIGNLSVGRIKRALKPQGRGIVAGFTTLPLLFQVMVLGPLISKKGGRKIGSMGVAKIRQEDLSFLSDLMAEGRIVPVIDRCYPLDQSAQALGYVEQGHAQGKVIITP